MAKLEISGAETDENCAWRQEKAHLESHRGWIGKKQSHTEPAPYPNETRTSSEQVPTKFGRKNCKKKQKKNKPERNPNKSRTSSEQVWAPEAL